MTYASAACPPAASSDVSATGLLHPFYRGVYAWGHAKVPLEGLFPGGRQGLRSRRRPQPLLGRRALALLKWDYRDPEVTARNPRRHNGIRAHRSQNIERTFRKGIPVTPPLRTLIDLSSMLPYATLRRAVNEALNQRLVKPHELVTTNHRGASKLRAVVASGPPHATSSKTSSTPSSKTSRSHTPTSLSSGTSPTSCWPAHRLILEADGRETHDQLLARADDKARQRVLEAHGYRVLRVTWRQATTQPAKLQTRLRAALADPRLSGIPDVPEHRQQAA